MLFKGTNLKGVVNTPQTFTIQYNEDRQQHCTAIMWCDRYGYNRDHVTFCNKVDIINVNSATVSDSLN